MERKISMKDIAQHVGVSIALVSYVMSGREGRVSPDMEVKIRSAAAELNYQPNLIARSLKSGKTHTLGLIVADISNPFFSHIARIIEDAAKQHGYTVIFGSSDESVEKSGDLIEALLNRQVDALIIAPAAGTEDQILSLKKRKVPFVLIDRYFPGIAASNVRIDNYKAAYGAVEHLVRIGRRRVALVSYSSGMEHMKEREKGYRQALKDLQVSFSANWLVHASYKHLESEVDQGLRQLLYPKPQVDALLFATNSLAIEGLKQLNRLKVRIPNDLAVISFDESDAFDLFDPPVSFVRQSLHEMGKSAVSLVLESIRLKTRKAQEVVVGSTLVLRASCGSKKVTGAANYSP